MAVCQDFEDAPLRLFHVRVLVSAAGGVLSDGAALGVVSIALAGATAPLSLTAMWQGLLGGASLIGLFAGALLTGPVADRLGRRGIFSLNMALLAALSGAQFFVDSAAQLLALRVALGFVLGTDYVVSKAMLTEFAPRRLRGRMLSSLSIAWVLGYVAAYAAGYALADTGADSWRWMLAAAGLPALLILPLRVTMPESPVWLAARGRDADALRIVQERIGNFLVSSAALQPNRGRWRQLFAPAWRRRTLVGCAFYTCQVIPYFAIGTYIPNVMSALQVQSSYIGGLVYNAFLLVGGAAGLLLSDLVPRRAFLVASFAVTAAALSVLSFSTDLSPLLVIVLFAVFACVLSAAANLEYVYTPELFPTELRASGIGLAIAASRIGSAASTVFLPMIITHHGVHVALGACAAVLVFGGLVCHWWAPETRHMRLTSMQPQADASPAHRLAQRTAVDNESL
jgi:putative MFS transporter